MTNDESSRPESLSRRHALRTIGAGVGALAVWPALSAEAGEVFRSIQRSQAAPKLRFLSPAQYATTDALAETLIPADAHSPGARAARVADFIDLLLSERDAAARQAWTDGLAALDAASTQQAGVPFAKATPAQQVEILTLPSRNEASPRTPLETFFKAAKDVTIRGYYTSEIGLLKDLQYKGNQFLGEFIGCTHPEHGFARK